MTGWSELKSGHSAIPSAEDIETFELRDPRKIHVTTWKYQMLMYNNENKLIFPAPLTILPKPELSEHLSKKGGRNE